MKWMKYIAFAVVGYIAAFVFIFAVCAVAGVSGWYAVYIPFLSILGFIIALFFANIGLKPPEI